jgi:hypothetical protein
METFVLTASFLGGWLLVAGPIYQAALELRDEDVADERIRKAMADVTSPTKVSAWWWLVPPVKIILERQRATLHRARYMEALPDEDTKALIALIDKATGWVFVGTGGLCIALKYTYEWTHHLSLSLPLFWLIVIVALGLSLGHAVYRIVRSERLIDKHTD